ncbi:lysis protein, partial [Xenorhabdus bovienii]|nr:lysis protein [Xenorhabdus bovienii]
MKWLNPHFLSLGLAILSVWLIFYYQGKYQQKAKDYDDLNTKYQTQVIAINQQQERIQHLAELDKTHTQELANAKTEIDILRADVAAGRRKLRIQAVCPVPETTPSGSVVDATTVG